jgi:hypothetical protein
LRLKLNRDAPDVTEQITPPRIVTHISDALSAAGRDILQNIVARRKQ